MLSREALHAAAGTRLPQARGFIDDWQYFIVHAPRQTGKTTTLETLARNLTAEGRHVALRVSCERAGEVGDDLAAASATILEALQSAAAQQLPERFRPPGSWADVSPGSQIFTALQEWAVACPLPLVLLFDEIDALHGFVLRSVLHQIRDGHTYRAQAFPASVVLCGMRDIRDYKAASGGDPSRLGSASPFNVAVESVRIRDFTIDEVANLYTQHTEDTGQEFLPDAVERAFDYTKGQPWLVNALANEIIKKMGIEPPSPITAEHVDTAKERLILARAPHFESLAARLNEPRVRRVIEPLIAGELPVVDEVWHPGQADPLPAGLAQLDRYLTRLKLDTGTLIIFDRRPGIPAAADRTRITQERSPEGRSITLMRA